MNSRKHDAALRRKIGGSKIFKRRYFRGKRYSKCVNSAAASNGSSITNSTLKSTAKENYHQKQCFISAANMESDNKELFLDNNFL